MYSLIPYDYRILNCKQLQASDIFFSYPFCSAPTVMLDYFDDDEPKKENRKENLYFDGDEPKKENRKENL